MPLCTGTELSASGSATPRSSTSCTPSREAIPSALAMCGCRRSRSISSTRWPVSMSATDVLIAAVVRPSPREALVNSTERARDDLPLDARMR